MSKDKVAAYAQQQKLSLSPREKAHAIVDMLLAFDKKQ